MIRLEFETVFGDEALEALPPEHAPEWVLVVVAMFGLLRLADIP